jgi:hypothetical protein
VAAYAAALPSPKATTMPAIMMSRFIEFLR